MTKLDELSLSTLTEVSALIKARQISPVELTDAMLGRIEAIDPKLHSYATVTPDLARRQAKEAEAEIATGRWRGPLHGIPIGLKDLCFTKDVPTAGGMSLYAGWKPDEDGTVVERLRLAGAVLLGKLQMTEGAYADHHPSIQRPLNPWNADYWAGASSSGSGVATAAGLCFGSLGSDTGGSIRFPSAMNGVTGLKPTWGRVSRHGSFVLSASLDHLGPMTRCAADAAAVLTAIAGLDDKDPTTLPEPVPDYVAGLGAGVLGARGLKIGIDPRFNSDGVEPLVATLTAKAGEVFGALGAQIVEITFPDVTAVREAWAPFCAVETALVHRETYPSRKSEYGSTLASFLDLGLQTNPLTLAQAAVERDKFKGKLARFFTGLDLVLMPAMFMGAPTFAQMTLSDAEVIGPLLKFTSPLDMSGSPTITMPCGFTAAGLPIGFQLVGPHLSEDVLLRAGHAFQQATDWHTRHPNL
jgi:amidase